MPPSAPGRPDLDQWLAASLKASGLPWAEVARLLSEQLRRAYHQSAIQKMVAGDREIGADEVEALTQVLGVSSPGAETDEPTRARERIAELEAENEELRSRLGTRQYDGAG